MARLNLHNGSPYQYLDASDLEENRDEILSKWREIEISMETELREQLHMELSPCDEIAFLKEYLNRAKYDLVIG